MERGQEERGRGGVERKGREESNDGWREGSMAREDNRGRAGVRDK